MDFAKRVGDFIKKSFTNEKNEDPDQDVQTDDLGNDVEGEDTMNKSMLDATDILGALVTELGDMNKSLKALLENQKTLEKSQGDVGEAVVSVAELVARIANTAVPTKTVLAKGNLGGGGLTVQQPAQPVVAPTQAEFERAQDVLEKSVREGEITMLKAEMISSSLQKAMVIPGYRMKPEDFDFLARKMQAA
jgi:hypothetical protein